MKNTSGSSYPLTALQQGLLYHSQIAPDSGLYIQQFEIRLHEQLKISSFKESWQKITAWCDVLRTRFIMSDNGDFYQNLVQGADLEWIEGDWSQFTPVEQEKKWQVYLGDDRRRGFDFSQAPLARLSLFYLGDDNYYFLWTFHHALLDGRSHLVVIRELFNYYEALSQGSVYRFAECVPFGEFARLLSNRDHGIAKEFWVNKLKGFEESTRLALAAPLVQPQTFEQQRTSVEVLLTKEVTEALRSFANKRDLRLGTVIQGSWAVLLSRYSGHDDVVFGATRACRHATVQGSESILGLLINTIPLRIQIDSDMPVIDWLKDIRSHWVSMRPYEHTPLSKIQKWIGFSPDKPLFESLLVYEDEAPDEVLEAQGSHWENRKIELHERGDYSLVAQGYGGSCLRLKISYDRCSYEDENVQQMLDHWRLLITSMEKYTTVPVAELPRHVAVGKREILADRNNTDTKQDRGLCIHQLIEAQVERTPAVLAVLTDDECLSYEQMNSRANKLAHYLLDAGVCPEVRVALCLERTPVVVVAVLAILKAGGAYVPLETDQPKKRLTDMLIEARVSLIVTQGSFLEKVVGHDLPVVCIDRDSEAISGCCDSNPASGVLQTNLAYALYTSGTMGKPKLIGVEHRSVVNLLSYATTVIYNPDDVAIVPIADAITFDPSIYRIFATFTLGGSIVLLQSYADLPFSRWADAYTLLGGAPSVLSKLLDEYTLPQSVRLITLGAETPSDSLLEKLQKYPDIKRVYSLYGPTETTVYCTAVKLVERLQSEQVLDGPSSVRVQKGNVIGKPIWNTRVDVLDSQMRPVPPGVSGEIFVSGACVARGYLNDPDLTAKRFVADPCSPDPAARLFKTGDLGRFQEDGSLVFLGRKDKQIKIRGRRIEPQGIERALDEYDRVDECAVCAVRDDAGLLHLVAYVVLLGEAGETTAATSRQNEKELRRYLKGCLPGWMIPEKFVVIDAMPHTVRGKVDFNKLIAKAALKERVYRKTSLSLTNRDSLGSGNELAEDLIHIWEDILGVSPITVHDDFFDLGGDSLRAVQLVFEIEKKLRQTLPLALFLENSTVSAIVDILRCPQKVRNYPKTMVAIRQAGSRRPLFFIHGRRHEGMVRYLDPEQPLYWLGSVLEYGRILELSVEEQAVVQIKNIQEVQPRGPYQLCGFSFGGRVAFEMAQQLRHSGEEVCLLALVDTTPPRSQDDQTQGKERQMKRQFAEIAAQQGMLRKCSVVGRKLRNWLLWRAGELPDRLSKRYRQLLSKYPIARSRVLPADLCAEYNGAAIRRVAREYEFQAYAGKILLFVPGQNKNWVEHANKFREQWQAVASEVEYFPIAGAEEHMQLLEEPCVQSLVSKLNNCLAASDEKMQKTCSSDGTCMGTGSSG